MKKRRPCPQRALLYRSAAIILQCSKKNTTNLAATLSLKGKPRTPAKLSKHRGADHDPNPISPSRRRRGRSRNLPQSRQGIRVVQARYHRARERARSRREDREPEPRGL